MPVMMMVGCIENDIPYPRIQPNFTEFSVENQSQAASIDTINRTVTVYLSEEADIKNVNVVEYKLSAGATIVGDSITGGIDLQNPFIATLKLYQEYEWTISAIQNIERNFTIANQVGATTIDVVAKKVIAYVSDVVDIKAVNVNSLKLGGATAAYSPDLTGQTVDFTSPVEVVVSEFGRDTKWTIYVEVTESSVTTVRADAWSRVAWLYGEAEVGKDNGFEYRHINNSEWTKVPEDWVTHDGGSFVARLIHLDPETQYVVRAYSDGEYGAEVDFLTGSEPQLQNPSFDNWWLDGKVWCPWAEDATSFWDTGNKGATTIGQSNSVPSDDTPFGIGMSAKLETKFVGVASLGKLAAGNLFYGSYVRTDGSNGVLAFGREFTQRPTKLTGYLKYNCAPISHTSAGFADLKNRPDTATVWVALADWAEPFEIRTNPNNRQLFDENAPEIIAYGRIQIGETIPEYIKFEVEFKYRDTQRVPRYIVVVSSASKYGDFFTGGHGSVLYVDDYKLEYDY